LRGDLKHPNILRLGAAALVVIDIQKGVVGLSTAHPTADVVANVVRLVEAFRAKDGSHVANAKAVTLASTGQKLLAAPNPAQ